MAQKADDGAAAGPKANAAKVTKGEDKVGPKASSGGQRSEEEHEFTIAADLTLYANPLRCLKKTSKRPEEREHAKSNEMIAADLVKYGSPLDDNPN